MNFLEKLPAVSSSSSVTEDSRKQAANPNLTTKEQLSSIWTGAKNKVKNMFCENGEISLKKIGVTALWAVCFAAGTRVGIAKGYVKANTVSRTLIGLGTGVGGYEVYKGYDLAKNAKDKKEKKEAFEKIGEGTATAAFSLLPAKLLSKGLNNIQGSANVTSKAAFSEVVKVSLDNKVMIECLKDKNTMPLLWYGAVTENMDF